MKKILVSLLAVMYIAVLITVLPVSAAETSGTCGENVTWEFDASTGVMTISGSGPIQDFQKYTDASWNEIRAEVKKVVIEDGVTAIGYKCFPFFTAMTEIVIPDSVKSIGRQAFVGCESLKSVNIPEGITEVPEFAFESCTALESVTFPQSLKSIGQHSFEYCTSLKKVVVPAKVEELWLYAFANCTSLEEVWFHCDCPEWIDMLFSGTTTTAYYPEGNDTWTQEKRDSVEGNVTWVTFAPEPCAHKNQETIKGKDATCTEDGLTSGKKCSDCGEVTVKQEKIKATGHSFGKWKTVEEPTTEKNGKAERKCSSCGKVEEKKLDKLPPEETEPPTTAPTEPPATEPPTTAPTEPPVTEPPTTAPTEPPATQPPTTAPAEPSETQSATKTPTTGEIAPSTTDQDSEPSGSVWGIVAIVAVVLLSGGAAAIVIIHRKKAK